MKRLYAVLLLLPVLAWCSPALAAAGADTPAPLTPVAGDRFFERYPVWSYTLDGDFTYQDFSGRLLGAGINSLMSARAWIVYTALRATEYALRVELAEPLAGIAATMHGALTRVFWEADGSAWVTAALALAGLLALIAALMGRRLRAWHLLGGTVATLLLALWLLAAAPALVGGAQRLAADTVATGVGPLVALLPGSGGDPDQRLLDIPGEAVWRTLVYEPWVWAEFGGPQVAAEYAGADGLPGSRLLPLLPSERQTFYVQVPSQLRGPHFAWWTADYTVRRLLLALILLIIAGAIAGVLLLLAGEIMLAQLFLMVWLASAPVLLLVALWWPGGGLWLVRRWLLRGLGALLIQVLAALALAGYLVLSFGLWRAFADYGWLLAGLLQALLAVAVFRYGRGWLALPALRLPALAWRRSGTAAAAPAAVGAAPAAEAPPGPDPGTPLRRDRQVLPVRPAPALAEPPPAEGVPPPVTAEPVAAVVLRQVHREFTAVRQELLWRRTVAGEAPPPPARPQGPAPPAPTPDSPVAPPRRPPLRVHPSPSQRTGA